MVIVATTWGDPAALRRVLLLHGLGRSSQFMHHLARRFASQGCFVTVPDLLGHGFARRGEVYTAAAFVEELLPFLSVRTGQDRPFHIVVGHCLGGVLAAVLLPHLANAENRPVRVVLVDPPLEMNAEKAAELIRMTAEGATKVNPGWTKEEEVSAYVAAQLFDMRMLDVKFKQNGPLSFSHCLSVVPHNVQVIVLAADPSKWAYVREEDLKAYPHITVKTVWGIAHPISFQAPEIVIETALEGIEAKEAQRTSSSVSGTRTVMGDRVNDQHLAKL